MFVPFNLLLILISFTRALGEHPPFIEFRSLARGAGSGKKSVPPKSNLYYSPIKFSFYHLCSDEFNYSSAIHSDRVTRADFVDSAFACLAGWYFDACSDLDRRYGYGAKMVEMLFRVFLFLSPSSCSSASLWVKRDALLILEHFGIRRSLPMISRWLSHGGTTTLAL